MSAFTALNIEYDSGPDEEVDDTKELQIEDALKLYQAALRFHSEGPSSYDKAVAAYRALFESDIFKYVESSSELRRLELEREGIWQDEFENGQEQLVVSADAAPNTLPQILHLSFKNRGQFVLDALQWYTSGHLAGNEELGAGATPGHIAGLMKGPLRDFSEALDKDDTDLDLWNRASAVATHADCSRIARYCLEAVLDADDEGLNSVLALPGIEDGMARQQLRELVQSLEDDLALLQPPLSNLKRKKLSAVVRRRLEPYSAIPYPDDDYKTDPLRSPLGMPPERLIIKPGHASWVAVGDAVLQSYLSDLESERSHGSYLAVSVDYQPDGSWDESQTRPLDSHEPTEAALQSNTLMEDAPEQVGGSTINDATGLTTKDTDSQEQTVAEQPVTDGDAVFQHTTTGLPTRKRSTDSAGLAETADGGRIRSKRIRARESLVDGPQSQDGPATESGDQLQLYSQADYLLFDTVGSLLDRLQINSLGSAQALRDIVSDESHGVSAGAKDDFATAITDLYHVVQTCPPEAAAALLVGEILDPLEGTSSEAGLNTFLGYAKSGALQPSTKPFLYGGEGLLEWSHRVNAQWLHIKEVAFAWIDCFIKPGAFPSSLSYQANRSSYIQHQWPGDLKQVIVQIAVNFDDYIYQRMVDEISLLDTTVLQAQSHGQTYNIPTQGLSMIEMIQTLFELHLDVYSLIKPSSGVDLTTRTLQKDRLERWSALARDALSLRSGCAKDFRIDELALRHIWASVFHINVLDDVSQYHIGICMEELRTVLASAGDPCIQLQNNAIMPELSVAAADRELSTINMKDFFRKIFDPEEADPVTVIESLEPILELQDHGRAEASTIDTDSNEPASLTSETAVTQDGETLADLSRVEQSFSAEMSKFLENGNVALRLSLWQRLRKAYDAIEYAPKIVVCYLRNVDILMDSLRKPTYREVPKEQRGFTLLRYLRTIDESVIKVLAITKSATDAFECIDTDHLRSFMDALAQLSRLLHAFNLYEDTVRVGQTSALAFESRSKPSFPLIANRLHDMQVRVWILQYELLKEAMTQEPQAFLDPAEHKFDYLHVVHNATGIRGFCKASDKTFLRFLRDEFLRLTHLYYCDAQLSQVLYDLYGLRCSPSSSDFADHGCEPNSPMEILDRKTAIKLLSFIMSQAQKINLKDLPKTELRATIEKVHGALGRSKANDILALNKKIYTAYVKSPINPVELFRCLQGVGELPTKPITPKQAVVASKGWYALMGNIALNRFRSQKRQGPGPTEDLNIAIAFFVQDLEYSANHWETWYRLAQAHDLQLEECVLWSAEKLNNNGFEVINFQRIAIHCYAMAVACAVRDEDTSSERTRKMAGMYADFGNRIYSSSRQPFSMNAFSFRESEEKYFSTTIVGKRAPFNGLRLYTAWHFASTLFTRSIARVPDQWISHYMLGKCLWKIYTADEATRGNKQSPTMRNVVDCFVRAIEMLPGRKDTRKEPILEPHYKLVSVVHKLVQRRDLEPQAASDIVQATHYARKVPPSTELDTWEPYALQVLKVLRTADKAGWHHRMTARAAHIIYDEAAAEMTAAMGAKHELTQQIFTKTMVVQVWKPEYERPGRHFVYTTRYTRFFMQLLVQLHDRTNLEVLVKRVRKKPAEFYNHSNLWQDLCTAYLKMLRRFGKVPEGHEDAVFKSLTHEEFFARAVRLEAWCQSSTTKSTLLDVLRDVIDLKKTNNGLMKPTLLDDLIGDAYAMLYEQIGPTLDPPPADAAPPIEAKSNMMSLNNLMNLDGTADQLAQPPPPPTLPPQPEQATKPPRKGVGRRELQRKAEAAVVRPIAPPAPVKSVPQTPATSHPQVVIEVQSSARPREGGGMEGSAPGSVHDSADDESGSELSELEGGEPVVAKPMFPNLVAAKATSPAEREGVSVGEMVVEGGEGEKVEGEMGGREEAKKL